MVQDNRTSEDAGVLEGSGVGCSGEEREQGQGHKHWGMSRNLNLEM